MATLIMRPTGDDVTGEWAPSTGPDGFSLVDEAVLNEADYVSASANDRRATYTFATSGIPAGSTINSVTGTYLIEAPAPDGILIALLGDASADVAAAGNVVILDDPGVFTQYASSTTTLNPATGLTWTLAEVNTLKGGIKTDTVFSVLHKLAQFFVTVDYTEPVSSGGAGAAHQQAFFYDED